MKFKLFLAAAVAAGTAGMAFASDDPTLERQALMKNVGAATGAGAAMAKGEAPFDAARAELVIRTMNAASLGFSYMFPEGSESGNNTEASPKIWSDRAGFNAAVDKFTADTALKGPIADLDAFKAAFGAATANCGSCHKAYRVKK